LLFNNHNDDEDATMLIKDFKEMDNAKSKIKQKIEQEEINEGKTLEERVRSNSGTLEDRLRSNSGIFQQTLISKYMKK